MSTTPSSTIEKLPVNIPRLKPDGTNWAIFSMRFKEAMQASKRWGYFDGTKSRPVPADPDKLTKTERQEMEAWDHEDLVARYLLSQHLPDTTTIRLSAYDTAKERWKRVNEEFTAKSIYAQNDLESAFLDMKCPKGGDVRTFLTSLRSKCEELAAAGVKITDRDYQRTVLWGILEELAKFASGLLSAAHLINATKTIETDTLIDHICEKSERLKNRSVTFSFFLSIYTMPLPGIELCYHSREDWESLYREKAPSGLST